MTENTKADYASVIKLLRDDNLVWSDDFESVRHSIADLLEACAELIKDSARLLKVLQGENPDDV